MRPRKCMCSKLCRSCAAHQDNGACPCWRTHLQNAHSLAVILSKVQPTGAGKEVQSAAGKVGDFNQVQVPTRLLSLVVMACSGDAHFQASGLTHQSLSSLKCMCIHVPCQAVASTSVSQSHASSCASSLCKGPVRV